jgi:hypothetical protein
LVLLWSMPCDGRPARKGGRECGWITTNDNTPALRFFQRLGFRLVAMHREAVTQSRRLKPCIAATGVDGIAIRDELELEWLPGSEEFNRCERPGCGVGREAEGDMERCCVAVGVGLQAAGLRARLVAR